MPRTTHWKCTWITHERGKAAFQIDYSSPHQVEIETSPNAALAFTLGELGGDGWEMVSVTASWQGEGAYATVYYFKRPHDGGRHLRE
jgi:hypothetical protein